MTIDRTHLNVFVVGPGTGEGIAVALPGEGFLVIDACKVGREVPLLEIVRGCRRDGESVDLVLTHPHEDHASGFAEAVEILAPRAIHLTARTPMGPSLLAIARGSLATSSVTSANLRNRGVVAALRAIAAWEDKGGAIGNLVAGSPIDVGQGVQVTACSPRPGGDLDAILDAIGRGDRESLVQPQAPQHRRSELGPALHWESADPRTELHAFDRPNPFELECAANHQTVCLIDDHLPRQRTDRRREWNDDELAQRGNDLGPTEHEHWPPLVRPCVAEPADITALDHASSGKSVSSSMGPWGPWSAQWRSRSAFSAADSSVSSFDTSTTTRTRRPSRVGSGVSSSMVVPCSTPVTTFAIAKSVEHLAARSRAAFDRALPQLQTTSSSPPVMSSAVRRRRFLARLSAKTCCPEATATPRAGTARAAFVRGFVTGIFAVCGTGAAVGPENGPILRVFGVFGRSTEPVVGRSNRPGRAGFSRRRVEVVSTPSPRPRNLLRTAPAPLAEELVATNSRREPVISVSRNEFLSDPAAVVRRSANEGAIGVRDQRGRVRAIVCVPPPASFDSDDDD